MKKKFKLSIIALGFVLSILFIYYNALMFFLSVNDKYNVSNYNKSTIEEIYARVGEPTEVDKFEGFAQWHYTDGMIVHNLTVWGDFSEDASLNENPIQIKTSKSLVLLGITLFSLSETSNIETMHQETVRNLAVWPFKRLRHMDGYFLILQKTGI